MSNNECKVIQYKGNEFAIGLTWQGFVGKNKSIIRSKIKDVAHRKKYDGFGVKIEEDKNSILIGFANKASKGKPSLAKIFASSDEYKNSLILIKLDDDKYWVCSITEKGTVVSGYDIIYTEDEFVEATSSYLAINSDSDFKIFIDDDDLVEIESLIDIEDFNVLSLSVEETLSGSHKNSEVDLVFNASADTLKQLGTVVLTGALLTCGYFFVYLEDNLYTAIVEQEVSGGYYGNLSKYKKFVKTQEKEINSASVVNAKKELVQIHNTTYDKDEVVSYIKQIFNDFPMYLVEWEFNDINYVNNNNSEFFRLAYKRIDHSYGYKEEFERKISEVLKDKGYHNFNFGYPSKKGDVIFINLAFKEKKELDAAEHIDKSKINENVLKLEKEMKKAQTKIESLESEVMELSFFNKRFGSSLSEYESDILNQVSIGNKRIKLAKEEREKLKVEDIEINEDIVSGSRTSMLSMIQQYSYYSWKDSSRSVQYPTLSKRTKKDETIQFYAQSFEFSVTTGSNIDVAGVNGLTKIMLDTNLLNKPYIRIKEVSFNLSSEVWSIKGESYEKI